jgi:hypothetical protein
MTEALQFTFNDGTVLLHSPTDSIRLRRAETYGVQAWTAGSVANGVWPPAPPHAPWVWVTATGVEHDCHGMTVQRGTLTPVAPPPAPMLEDEAEPVETVHIQPVAQPAPAPAATLPPVAPPPARKRGRATA